MYNNGGASNPWTSKSLAGAKDCDSVREVGVGHILMDRIRDHYLQDLLTIPKTSIQIIHRCEWQRTVHGQ
jgi:hypothetical protein